MLRTRRQADLPSWLLLLGLCLGLTGCAPQGGTVRPSLRQMSYAEAVDTISASLATQIQGSSPSMATPAQPGVIATISSLSQRVQQSVQKAVQQVAPSDRRLVVNPFTDAQTGYGTRATQRLQDDLARSLLRTVTGMQLQALNSTAAGAATHVMSGSIGYESGGPRQPRRYYLAASVLHLESGRIEAQASAWLASERELDMTPLPSFQDSPVYLNDRQAQGIVRTSRTVAGQIADPDYLRRFGTTSLIAEAQLAYASENYSDALGLYRRAESRPDGRSVRTYAGIYASLIRLGNMDDAEQAFGQLVAAAFAENNLSIRFLFRVNSTEFLPEIRLTQQYDIWVRQLSQQIARSRTCVEVIGHSSRTGGDAYNEQLSLQRAERIRALLQVASSATMQLTRAIGRGSRENLVGSGTDDLRDAIDRRVEFRIAGCT